VNAVFLGNKTKYAKSKEKKKRRALSLHKRLAKEGSFGISSYANDVYFIGKHFKQI